MMDDVLVPTRRTLDRSRLHVDVALMMVQRLENDEAVQRRDIYNLMFDSSPIRGRNWFQIQSVRVPGDVLLQGGSAILALKRSGQQMKAALEDPEAVGPALAAQLEESQSLASVVGTTMRTHVLPPTVLAQKKTKLQHKATNLVHVLRLECSNWNVVRKTCT